MTPARSTAFALHPAGRGATIFLVATALVPVVLASVLVLSLNAAYRATLELDGRRVAVRGALYGRSWAREAIDPDTVRVTDLSREPALRPTLRTNGTAFPGYAEGWFRLRGGQRALLFTTSSTVVVAEVTEGYLLMFSAARPEAAAEALREGGSGRFTLAAPRRPLGGFVFGSLAIVVIPLGLLLGFLARAMRRTEFLVDAAGLRIRGMFPGRPVPHDALDLERARVVDLTVDRSLRVRWRTWGAGMPGYVAGWCRLANGEKALVQVTAKRPVLYLPTRLGYALLLSTAEAEVMLAALRAHRSRPSPGTG